MQGKFSRSVGIVSCGPIMLGPLHLIAQMKLAFEAVNMKHLVWYLESYIFTPRHNG